MARMEKSSIILFSEQREALTESPFVPRRAALVGKVEGLSHAAAFGFPRRPP